MDSQHVRRAMVSEVPALADTLQAAFASYPWTDYLPWACFGIRSRGQMVWGGPTVSLFDDEPSVGPESRYADRGPPELRAIVW